MTEMTGEILGDADFELINSAREAVLRGQLYPERHRIGAALLTESGETFVGVSLLAEYVKSADVCAEQVALGQWATAACTSPVVTVAVMRKPRPSEADQHIKVVSSCGTCRELLSDYFPEARLIVPAEEGLRKYTLEDLLPSKYRSTPRDA